MEKHNFIELIDKYLAGSASEAESRLVEEYLKRMEAAGRTTLLQEEEEQLKQNMWQQIQKRAGGPTAKVIKVPWYRAKVMRLAAAVAAACVLLAVFIWKPWERAAGDFETITVALGEPIEKAKLADGSLVWVKPGSSLSYPKAFKGGSREIDLKGEALFEVAKDPQHPFIVHSGTMDVQVLGTSFNIRDAGEKDMVEIAVLTGRVRVDPSIQSGPDKIELQPYDKLVISKKEGTVQKSVFTSAESYTAGTHYNMRFVDAPLETICSRIEEKFDVVVELNEPGHEGCRVRGDFTDRSLQHTVDVLCKTIGARYSIRQDTVRISGLQCK